MPETYGLPEPEPTPDERVAQVIAGRGVVRRVVLYASLLGSLVIAIWLPPTLAVSAVAAALLMATDSDLA